MPSASKITLNGKLCKRARALLGWNIQDVSSRCTLRFGRIDMFEKCQTRLTRPENDALVRLFEKYHIIFKSSTDVRLVDPMVDAAMTKDYQSYEVTEKEEFSDKDGSDAYKESQERKKRLRKIASSYST